MKALVDARPNLSVITTIEVFRFNATNADSSVLNAFMSDAIIFELTSGVAEQTITIRKSYKIKLPDAIITATTLVHSIILVTRNTNDFDMIDKLQTMNLFYYSCSINITKP